MSEEINLPEKIEEVLELSMFDIDNLIQDATLNQFLFYIPDIIKLIGLEIAALKAAKRSFDQDIYKEENINLKRLESDILIELAYGIDSQRYKNEQMRTAKVMQDQRYIDQLDKIQEIKKLKDEIEYKIDRKNEYSWKYKNLNNNLDNLSKLRISERRY